MKYKQHVNLFYVINSVKINKIKFYTDDCLNPYHNLAVEEFLTTHVQENELIMYLWQNEHTIVIGRNQNTWQECRVKEFEKSGGKIARRLSGGGAVYHDLGNLNFTFCVQKVNYDVERQLNVILKAVQSLDINAEKTGRNDITIAGKKFSGNAFYKAGKYCYHHGTLLLDVDTEKMMQYLNVDMEKLQSKGVSSVKSRVINLKECCVDISRKIMTEKIKSALKFVYNCDIEDISKADLDESQIKQLENKFSDWNWIFGRKIQFTNHIKRRFAWGNIDIYIIVCAGIIKDIEIYSDMMEQDFILDLKEVLKNCRYDADVIITKIKDTAISQKQKYDLIELIQTEL